MIRKLFNAVKNLVNGVFANLFLIENTLVIGLLGTAGLICAIEVSTKGKMSCMLHDIMLDEYKKPEKEPAKKKSPQRRKSAKKDDII